MSLDIEWLEPPLSTEARIKEALKGQPGRWARVKKNMASPTSKSAWRKEGFEAESHPSAEGKGRYDIYVRWPAGGEEPTRVPAAAAKAAAPAPAAGAAVSATVRPAAGTGKPVGTDVNGAVIRDGIPTARPAGGYKYRGNEHD